MDPMDPIKAIAEALGTYGMLISSNRPDSNEYARRARQRTFGELLQQLEKIRTFRTTGKATELDILEAISYAHLAMSLQLDKLDLKGGSKALSYSREALLRIAVLKLEEWMPR